ncbi:hypothetical protein EON65_56420 [archaeon]|nr:MAG: hypothetical protein EON65_56420 [archaeon]
MFQSVLAWRVLPNNSGRLRNVHLASSHQLLLTIAAHARGLSSTKSSSSDNNYVKKSIIVAKTTGVLAQTWPTVHPAATHFKRALIATKTIKLDPSIKNARQAQRKYTAMYIDGLMKALNAPLTKLLTLYDKGGIKRLHPYEVNVPMYVLVFTCVAVLESNCDALRSSCSV